MDEPYSRLVSARIAAGYKTAVAAAEAMGVKPVTYIHHENGTNGLSRAGERYAKFFRVSFEWLMHGRGQMRPGSEGRVVGIHGAVGAGASVLLIGDALDSKAIGEFEFPSEREIGGLIVRGESQWPRFLDGEVILYDPSPVNPEKLIGKYAIVQTLDGNRMIKILQRGSRAGTWRLDSHNAAPVDQVELLGVWRYIGTMAERQ